MTRQLLAYSRRQVLEPKVIIPNAIVTDAERLLRRLIGEDITLSVTTSSDLWPVRVAPGQFEQVLLKLAVNARDAMPTGGLLSIETANADVGLEYSAIPEVRVGRYVLIAVSDTGTGMTPEVQARVFDPFFTTKGVGQGTGLGLATVHGIVKQSGGFVSIYSEVGRGTTFKVYLPAAEQVLTPQAVYDPLAPSRGDETILLAEDDEAVRGLIRQTLRVYGYKVLEAANGEEVIWLAAAWSGTIQLLVMDVVMPGMSGSQLAERIVSTRPEIKVLYLSGYTDGAVVRHGVLEARVQFLQKPFTPARLAAKVREVLDRQER